MLALFRQSPPQILGFRVKDFDECCFVPSTEFRQVSFREVSLRRTDNARGSLLSQSGRTDGCDRDLLLHVQVELVVFAHALNNELMCSVARVRKRGFLVAPTARDAVRKSLFA
jgi:hypothetical protein